MGTAVTCGNCGKQTNSDENIKDCPECNRPYPLPVVEASTPTSAPKQK